MDKAVSVIGLLFSIFILSACVPIKSQVGFHESSSLSGVGYFLPQRDLLIRYKTLPENDQCQETLEINTSEPYADPAAGHIAKIDTLFMGNNNSKLVVTPGGLLHSAVSDISPAFREIVVSAASSFSELANRRIAFDRAPDDALVCVERDLKWTINLPTTDAHQGNHLWIEDGPMGFTFQFNDGSTQWSFLMERPIVATQNPRPQLTTKAHGLFYRMNMPYRIRFDEQLAKRLNSNGGTVFLPNESPSLLAPTPGSVFGKKVATATFENGILVAYHADFEGDGKQVAALPVEVLGAITAATGNVFRDRKNQSELEQSALKAELRLQHLQRQQIACQQALKQQDSAKIDTDCDF